MTSHGTGDTLAPHDLAVPDPPGADAAPRRARRLRLVIADDDPDIRLSLHVLLTGTDHFDVVGEAQNGVEAIEACRNHAPDVLLLDLVMPVMDGYEALPIIRHANPDTRVIVYSGQEAHVGEPRVRELGATGYIEKNGAVLGIWQRILEILDIPLPRNTPNKNRNLLGSPSGRRSSTIARPPRDLGQRVI